MSRLNYLFFATTLAFIFSLQGCCSNRNDEDPIQNQISFTISNDQGNLFLSPNTYTLDSIKIFEENLNDLGNYDFFETAGIFTLYYGQGNSVSDELFEHTIFLELPSSDIDTITFDQVRTPTKCGRSDITLENVFFNGDRYDDGNPFTSEYDFVKK